MGLHSVRGNTNFTREYEYVLLTVALKGILIMLNLNYPATYACIFKI